LRRISPHWQGRRPKKEGVNKLPKKNIENILTTDEKRESDAELKKVPLMGEGSLAENLTI
jgi:hypothetical protein